MEQPRSGPGGPSGAGATEGERLRQRQELKEQNVHVQQNKEVLCSVTNNRLDEAIKKADSVLEKADGLKAKEASAHAQLFANLAECGYEAANKLATGQPGRSAADFITALRATFVHTANPQVDGAHEADAFQWNELGASLRTLFRVAPRVSCMFGPMEAQPKERKVGVRAKRGPLGELQRPDELDAIVEEDKQETDRNMEIMWGIIRGQHETQVPVAELCCNYQSFAQTVENLFTLSFLVRDNRVAMAHDSQLGLCVKAIDSKKKGDQAGGSKAKPAPEQRQFILNFHMDDWDNMRKLVAPSGCMMPHRAAHGTAATGRQGRGQSRADDDGAGAGQTEAEPAGKKQRRQR